MYNNSIISIRILGEETREFVICIGLHQGLAVSLYLFALVMHGLTKHIQDQITWCMLFVDDVILVDTCRECVKLKLEMWRNALEAKGFKSSRIKIEYLKCNFYDK